MWRTLAVALTTAALLFGTAATAAAADYCMQLDLIGYDGTRYPWNFLILKDFSLPRKGRCKVTQGFYAAGPFWVTGMACGSSNGVDVTFFHTGSEYSGRKMVTDTFRLNRTTALGFGAQCFPALDSSGGSCYSETMGWTEISCGAASVLVP